MDYGLIQKFDKYEIANQKATSNSELMNLVINPEGISNPNAKLDVQGIIKEMEMFELISGGFKRREIMTNADQANFYT